MIMRIGGDDDSDKDVEVTTEVTTEVETGGGSESKEDDAAEKGTDDSTSA